MSTCLSVCLSMSLFIVCLCRYLEEYPPFYRQIKREELWLYKNPVTQHDTVPTNTLFVRDGLTGQMMVGGGASQAR